MTPAPLEVDKASPPPGGTETPWGDEQALDKSEDVKTLPPLEGDDTTHVSDTDEREQNGPESFPLEGKPVEQSVPE